MNDQPSPDQIASATGYEELLVPALLGQWTGRVLDAARVGAGDRILDVACGTGVLARAAAERVGPSGKVEGIDPDPGMLAVAGRLEPGIGWRRATAESLPYRDGSFDATVSQFGMMFFADPRLAVAEMRRVLAKGGRLAVAVWDTLETNPGYAAEVALLDRLAGARAADAVRLPFTLGDRDALAALLAEAGLDEVAVATYAGKARFPSVRVMVAADLRGWLPLLGIDLEEDLIERILTGAEEALAGLVAGDGTVEFALSAHVISGFRKNSD